MLFILLVIIFIAFAFPFAFWAWTNVVKTQDFLGIMRFKIFTYSLLISAVIIIVSIAGMVMILS